MGCGGLDVNFMVVLHLFFSKVVLDMSVVPTNVEEERLKSIAEQLIAGEKKFNNLSQADKNLILNQSDETINKELAKIIFPEKSNQNVPLKETNVEEEPSSEENTLSATIKNDDTVKVVDITNPPPFLKIGNHVFTTHEDKLLGRQSKTNFNMPGGEGSVYTDLKRIYGVHPDETPRKYNLLLHNFGVYYKNDLPLFEKGSCVPGSKDAIQQILNVGIAHLTAKKNATKSSLRNASLVKEQITKLQEMLEKLKTMGESPVCDINQEAPAKATKAETVVAKGPMGPVPNCLQDTKMLQSFLNMLTLMMGIMSDDDKRKNLKAINLKDILAIGTKDPKSVTDTNRQVVSAKIEELLKILQSTSTTADVKSSTEIQDFLEALKEDEYLQRENPSGLEKISSLNDVLNFFKSMLMYDDDYIKKQKEEIQELLQVIEIKHNEIQQIQTENNQEQEVKARLLNDNEEFRNYLNTVVQKLGARGENNESIMQDVYQKIDAFRLENGIIQTENQQLQNMIDEINTELQAKKNEIEEILEEKRTDVADITRLEGELAAANTRVADAEAALAAAQEEYQRAQQTSTDALATKDAELAAKQQALDAANAELAAAQQAQARLQEELAAARTQIQQAANAAQASEEQKEQFRAQVATLEANLGRIRTELETMTSARNTAQGSIATTTQELENAQAALRDAQAATQAIQTQLNEKNTQLSTFETSFAELQRANQDLQTRLATLQTEKVSTIQRLTQEHEAAIQELRRQIQAEQNAQAVEQRRAVNLEEQLQRQASAHRQEIERMTSENERLQKQLNDRPTQNDLNEKNAEINELERQMGENNAQILNLTRQLAENESLQENLTAANAEKTRLQGELATLQETSNGNQDTIARLQDEIRQKDARIQECEAQAQALIAAQARITQLEADIAAERATKTEIQTRLNDLTPRLATTTQEKDEKEQARLRLVAELNAKQVQIDNLQAERDRLTELGTAKDTEIDQLRTQLENLQAQAQAAASTAEIEGRLNTVLPLLLVDSTIQQNVKDYITTGEKAEVIDKLKEHKSTMCMIFQMVYALIKYNNKFIDSIPYGFGGGTVYSELNSTKQPLYFYNKETPSNRITYTNTQEILLLKEIISLFSIISITKDNTKVQHKEDFPILFDMLSKKDNKYLGNTRDGSGSLTKDQIVYNALDNLFPRNIYGGIYSESDRHIYYSTKTERAFQGTTQGAFLSYPSYTRISLLLIMLTQLINKHITPKLEKFISNCGIILPPPPTYAVVASQTQTQRQTAPGFMGSTASSAAKRRPSTTLSAEQIQRAQQNAARDTRTTLGSRGGDASELIAFDEE